MSSGHQGARVHPKLTIQCDAPSQPDVEGTGNLNRQQQTGVQPVFHRFTREDIMSSALLDVSSPCPAIAAERSHFVSPP